MCVMCIGTRQILFIKAKTSFLDVIGFRNWILPDCPFALVTPKRIINIYISIYLNIISGWVSIVEGRLAVICLSFDNNNYCLLYNTTICDEKACIHIVVVYTIDITSTCPRIIFTLCSSFISFRGRFINGQTIDQKSKRKKKM